MPHPMDVREPETKKLNRLKKIGSILAVATIILGVVVVLSLIKLNSSQSSGGPLNPTTASAATPTAKPQVSLLLTAKDLNGEGLMCYPYKGGIVLIYRPYSAIDAATSMLFIPNQSDCSTQPN